MSGLIHPGTPMALPKRGLILESCQKWGVGVSEYKGKRAVVFNYRDTAGRVVAQKVRTPPKEFIFLGDTKSAGLFGQHLWRDGGKSVVVTTGEFDAVALSQVRGHTWPVVSVPTGDQGARKSISRSLDWLLTYDTVILMFDQDDSGRAVVAECARLFPPGKCKVAKLPLKDPNAMLLAGREKELVQAVFEAKTWRPDGIVTLGDIKAAALRPVEIGLPWFLEPLTAATYGRRLGEVYGLGAGTGVGKTDLLTQQIEYDVMTLREPVGAFFLEQHPVETVKRIAGKHAGKRFHVPNDGWTQDELTASIQTLEESGKLFLYDNFGAAEWDVIQSTIRYLAHSEGVRLFYLDHLTALAVSEGDERTALERIMAEMAALAKELNVIVHFISHLATPEGRPHEEGGRVMIRHFKGSRAIGFWSHLMLGLERNQQAGDEQERRTTTLRVLKDRYTGQATGKVILLGYEQSTGRLFEQQENPFERTDDGCSGPPADPPF